MRLLALNGHARQQGPWRGALVVQADNDAPGTLLDPTGALAARLETNAFLRRRAGLDQGPRAVVLTAARIDQVAGLIGLRHGQPIDLYTTPSIFEDLTTTVPVLPEVQRQCDVHWRLIPVAGDQARADFHIGQQSGLNFTAVASRSAPSGRGPAAGAVLAGPALALAIEDAASGRRLVWLRGRHRYGYGTGALLEGADLIAVGAETDDPDDALVDWLAAQAAPRKWLVGGRPADRGRLERLGIEQPRDGELFAA